jgi:hypothetical protein
MPEKVDMGGSRQKRKRPNQRARVTEFSSKQIEEQTKEEVGQI